MRHLERLVANHLGGRIGGSQYEPFRLAFVASAQYSQLKFVLKQTNQIFSVRRFTRAAHTDITNADNWNVEAARLQYALIEHKVAHRHYSSVYPSKG